MTEFVKEALIDRFSEVERRFGYKFPCIEIYDFFLELCEEYGIDETKTASSIVDNAIVNGDYGHWTRYFGNENEAKEALKCYKDGESDNFIFACMSKSDNEMYFVKNF